MPFRISIAAIACLTLVLPISTAIAAERANLATARASIRSSDLKRHTDRLSDDTFEGREAGSRGGHASGTYLVQEFERLKLQPAGPSRGYYQEFGGGYRNILGLWEGSDPALKDEVILVGAHYDHVGYGNSENSNGPTGYIHNGADDNASGTAALIECIEAITQLDPHPKRTILFALWDAEEKGLLGSQYWIENPSIAKARVKLAFNMDMVGRLRKDRVEVYGTRTARGLRRLISAHNKPGARLDFTWEMSEDSDHYTFFRAGIPSVMLHTGLHDEYHTPRDDAELLNVDGMQRVSELMFDLILGAADAESLPSFRQRSRSETNAGREEREQPLAPLRSRLGVAWEKTPEGKLRIARVVPGAPAAEAELATGDTLVSFNGAEITADSDFGAMVLAAENPATIVVQRGEEPEPRTITVTLRGAPVRLGLAWRGDEAEPDSVILTRVVPGSPAAKAGLQLRDRVYSVAGQTFEGPEQCGELLRNATLPLELEIEREGQVSTVVVE
jgi:hypothetical protein